MSTVLLGMLLILAVVGLAVTLAALNRVDIKWFSKR